MSIIDLFVIYLACGAPLGVYHFINAKQKNATSGIESLLVTILWIPYMLKLLHARFTVKLRDNRSVGTTILETNGEEKINRNKKDFEAFLPENLADLSLFEFREIIERYAGLTYQACEQTGNPAEHEKEIFRVSGTTNIDLSSKCLNRRNRQRLLFHQNCARRDFLNALEIIFRNTPDQKSLTDGSLEFLELLGDSNAKLSIEKLSERYSLIRNDASISNLQKDSLKPKEQKHLQYGKVSSNSKAIAATAVSTKND